MGDQVTLVDPTNADVLYAGGLPLFRWNGATWADITDNTHVDQHAIAWAGTRLVVGNDGGVFSTIDNGVNWTKHNTGLVITQFYFGSVHPTNATFALGGSQDNGVEKWAGTSAWTSMYGGDGMSTAFSAADRTTAGRSPAEPIHPPHDDRRHELHLHRDVDRAEPAVRHPLRQVPRE
jgi:hypothetical protein